MNFCKLLSIVIPCFNEEPVILKTLSELYQELSNLISQNTISDFELIFVDDGSKDATLSILKEESTKNSKIKVIALSRNFGHQLALMAGLKNATGDAVISMDADLQDPIYLIGEMVKKFNAGADIVFGVRNNRENDTIFKKKSAQFFYKIMKFFGVTIIEDHADFRLLSKRALLELCNYEERNLFLRGIIPSLGFRQEFVYYKRPKRLLGETKYPFHKMLEFALDGITSFSYIPLRFATYIGFLSMLASFLVLIWVLFTKIYGDTVPGWASILLPMIFFGSIQLFFLGVIGEYIGKIYTETKRRPTYIIMEKYNF